MRTCRLAIASVAIAATALLAAPPVAAEACSPTYISTLHLAGEGTGAIYKWGYRVCPGDCSYPAMICVPGQFPFQITLKAVPGPGSYFAGWSGDCTGTDDCVVPALRVNDITATFRLYAPQGVDLSVTQSASPAPGLTGRDVVYSLQVTNTGPATATGVTLQDTLPAGAAFVWASPGCARAGGQVDCAVGDIAGASSANATVVVRPTAAGAIVNAVAVSTPMIESDYANNASSASIDVTASPAAQAAQRWRLYGVLTREHHFTMSVAEYSILGQYPETWTMEGPQGNLLDNPGAWGGVTAVPYYRLYQSARQQHHWTTDANEYYTLVQFPDWVGEGIDGFILPTQAPGSIPLYRLLYPFVEGLHHWTIDPVEYAILIADYGWIGEPGSGFVIP